MQRLEQILTRIDGKGYGAYKDLKGDYRFPGFALTVDHVQGDPFAAPSRIRVTVPEAGFPPEYSADADGRRALADYLCRRVATVIHEVVQGARGMGKSGHVAICPATQQVLTRSAVTVRAESVEARLSVGLPARGRTVLGREAAQMLLHELPRVVDGALVCANQDADALARHLASVRDQVALRRWVVENACAAFIADGSMLARRSGVDERPLTGGQLSGGQLTGGQSTGAHPVPFNAPDSLAATVTLPHAGAVRGMAIPPGVTLIVGGGFHGKSTLLNAIQTGIYDHLPGDGRERVATDPTAVKVQAEDGRAVSRVDIHPFIGELPFARDTVSFSTENASGSTSQAAAIAEALEAGSKLLLIDEDTSATNFMIRDGRMRKLVADHKEPITPFLFRVRELYERHGVSTVVVMGGSGDYLSVADTVIMMDEYTPRDVTQKARELAGEVPPPAPPCRLIPDPRAREVAPVSAARGQRIRIQVPDRGTLRFGDYRIDLSRVAQLADVAQTRAIGWLLHHYETHHRAAHGDLLAGLAATLAQAREQGLDAVTPYPLGDLALPRLFELIAAAGRVRRRDPAPDAAPRPPRRGPSKTRNRY